MGIIFGTNSSTITSDHWDIVSSHDPSSELPETCAKVIDDFNVDLTPIAGLALQRLMSYAGRRGSFSNVVWGLPKPGNMGFFPCNFMDLLGILYEC